MERREKIVVAMSGGVDSSVAAALLVEQGHDVTGMMLKLWADDCSEAENSCCPPEAIAQARQVAGIIGIPFYVLDVRELFKKQIVDDFIDGYRKGITPNPCFYCNKNIRWGFLLDRILDSGADKIATGHYARIDLENGEYLLKKGMDPLKDQSYVLSGLNQAQLSHTTFPLGELKKTEVRELAHRFGLPVAEKHDSQDLCFVGEGGYRDFMHRHSPESFKSGEIKLSNGQQVGEHDGLANYTIGQRKGLGAGFSQPIYVIEKNVETNEIIVGYEEELGRKQFSAKLLNWPNMIPLNEMYSCEVKTRYKASLIQAKIQRINSNEILVLLEKPQRDITPGQIAVFYQKDVVIGSAVISNSMGSGGKQ